MDDDDAAEAAEPVALISYSTVGEAEIAQAKLHAYGIDSVLDDQVEGGLVVIEGEPGIIVQVRAEDAEDARRILLDTVDDATIDEAAREAESGG
jgi:hypothetical protein